MVRVKKIAHAVYEMPDIDKQSEYYTEVIGLTATDKNKDAVYLASTLDHHSVVLRKGAQAKCVRLGFLRCGPDHHTINLMQIDSNRHFHTAFELRDWAHLQTACDFLSLNGYKLIWGPGRHGIGHNLFAYHRAPNGLITELFAELDQVNEELGYFEPRPWHRDRPQKPKVWPKDPSAANLWGVMPPDEMMK